MEISPFDVTAHENETYRQFVSDVATKMGVFDFEPEQVVWHYTNAPGFLGILESAAFHATQVASLNDSNETKYATSLYKDAIKTLIAERSDSASDVTFMRSVLNFLEDPPDNLTHRDKKFFVVCFSGDEDDVNQWDRYSKPNGYALGFRAGGLFREPTSQLYKVVYDKNKQLEAAKAIASATLDFYREGLTAARLKNPETWATKFIAAWDGWIYKLAPLSKDASWEKESEFRVVHEVENSEFAKVRFKQKGQILARYLPLDMPVWMPRRHPLLPLAKVIVGPGNHEDFTPVSARLLLSQMGYDAATVEVVLTRRTLVWV